MECRLADRRIALHVAEQHETIAVGEYLTVIDHAAAVLFGEDAQLVKSRMGRAG